MARSINVAQESWRLAIIPMLTFLRVLNGGPPGLSLEGSRRFDLQTAWGRRQLANTIAGKDPKARKSMLALLESMANRIPNGLDSKDVRNEPITDVALASSHVGADARNYRPLYLAAMTISKELPKVLREFRKQHVASGGNWPMRQRTGGQFIQQATSRGFFEYAVKHRAFWPRAAAPTYMMQALGIPLLSPKKAA
ncbi:MAG: hypothetical protein V4510_02185 [bacterium]